MTSPSAERYLAEFSAREKQGDRGPAWLRTLRREAIGRFEALGFPSQDQEAWRFTRIDPIARTEFHPAPAAGNGSVRGAVDRFAFAGVEGDRAVFVDGRFAPDLSFSSPESGGARVRPLAQVLRDEPGAVETHLGRHAGFQDQPFVALNTALFADGALVEIPAGASVPRPIHLLFLASGNGLPTAAHPRVLIVAGEGSRTRVVESYTGVGQGARFTNAVTEVVLGRNAEVDHCRVQRETDRAFHVATLQFHQEGDSRATSHVFSIGAALARTDLNVRLAGRGAGCALNGVYVASGRQFVDHHTLIDHAAPHGTSLEYYKGVLDEAAGGVFHGKIVVQPDAQKTNARQTNKNLLLSKDATVNTQPQLEIYADDVKCTHGATIGRLDENALYYLRSRGLAPGDARILLILGFLREITGRVPDEPVRARLEDLAVRWLCERSCWHEG